MMKFVPTLAAAAVLAASAAFTAPASAAPLSGAPTIKNAAPSAVTTVQWRGRGGRGGFRGGWRGGWRGGRSWGPGPFFAGALLGGALFAPYYYDPYYYPYYPRRVYVRPYGDDVSYCMARFRSYDPASGTYLGYDGRRHPCP